MQATAVRILVAIICLVSVAAEVSTSDISTGFHRVNLLDEEKKTKYIVAVDKDGDTAEPEAATGFKFTRMADKHGRVYSCSVPPLEGANNSTSPIDAQVTATEERLPKELLAGMDDDCASHTDDWWTYEICFRKYVRQFHNQADSEGVMRLASEYQLGHYNESASDLNRVKVDVGLGDVKENYVSELYDDGEACDITGHPRQVEVRYVCGDSEEEKLRSVQEASSCKYVAVMETLRLCGLPGFRAILEPAVHILCRALPGQPPGPSFGDTAALAADPTPRAFAESGEGAAGLSQPGAQAMTAEGGSRISGIEDTSLGGDVAPAEAHAAGVPTEDDVDDPQDDDAEASEEDSAEISAADAAYEAVALARRYNDPGHDAAHDEL